MKKLIAILAIILVLGIYLAYIEYVQFVRRDKRPGLSPLETLTAKNKEKETGKPAQRRPTETSKPPEPQEREGVGDKKPPGAANARATQIAEALQAVHDKKKEQYMKARKLLTDVLLREKPGKQRDTIKAALEELNKKMIFSRMPTEDSVIHVVQPGDTLWRIAKKYGTTPGMIMLVNQKSRDIIRQGERLKILKGKVKLLIDYSDFTLTVLLNGHYVKQYRIGIGKYEERRPTGTFVIETKKERPTWYAPDGKVYPYGHPGNVLGTRWIGFKETPEWAGYGIHGTDTASSIGKAASEGCIRLLNKDVEELFRMVPRGTEVEIRN